MPHMSEQNFEAQEDLNAIQRASQVEADAGRMSRLRGYLEDQKKGLDEALNVIAPPSRSFNNTVRNKGSL